MTPRTEANSLKAFIEKRWAEARTELEEHDPAYVTAVEALDNLQDKLTLPSQISSSSYSLPRKWVDLLESTLVVSLALEDLHLAVSLLNPDATSKVAHWYLDVWMQFAFNLVEKVKVLVSFTCGVHGLGSMKDRYRHRLDSEGVQGQLRQRRDPLVHGAGGEGSIVRRAIMSDESLPVFMDMVPGQLTRWIFRPGPRLPAPIRYRWELTGTGSSNSDIVVEGDKGPPERGRPT